jgi:Ca2+-binding RTX toxin-like protein
LGGAGDDTLFAGDGTDRLFGGSGDDTFVIRANAGRDIIGDFDVQDDVLDVRGNGAHDVGDLSLHVVSGGTIVTLPNGTSFFLAGIDLNHLPAGVDLEDLFIF